MGKPSKLTVRAQRKYAHKAYIPVNASRNDPEPPDVEQAGPSQPVLVRTRRAVNNLVDEIAFRNIHVHPEDLQHLRDVRVVLERISPNAAVLAEVSRQPDVEMESPEANLNIATERNKKKKVSRNKPDNSMRKKKSQISQRRISLSQGIITRNRLRAYYAEDNAKSKQKGDRITRNTLRARAIRTSDTTSMDENCPLSEVKKQKRNRKQKYRKKITRQTKNFVKGKKVFSPKKPAPAAQISDSASVVWLGQPAPNPPDAAPLNPPLVNLPSTSTYMLDYEESIRSLPVPIPNPLADFVIRIFNNNRSDSVVAGTEKVVDIQDPVTRVQEWLKKSQGQQSGGSQVEDYDFKVPLAPRGPPPAALSVSSARSIASAIPVKERTLRSRCITWNFKTLSGVVKHKQFIKKFCGECSRCRVMFLAEHLKLPGDCYAHMTPRFYIDADVYEFIADKADSAMKVPLTTVFTKIAAADEHLSRLKQIMTDKGKKVLKAAIIVNGIIEKSRPLSAHEHTCLAQVIGILNECNSVRDKTTTAPVPRLSRTPSREVAYVDVEDFESPLPPRCPEVKNPPPRSRTLVAPGPSRSNQVASTSSRKSMKFTITEGEAQEGPIMFAKKIKQQHPDIALCGIILPDNFRPTLLRANPEKSFKIINQYLHRMLHRWGKMTQELTAIRSLYNSKPQRLPPAPLYEGLEIDLVKLFGIVQHEGGLEACQHNFFKWQEVARKMKLVWRPKTSSKLDKIYLRHLLSYESMTPEERANLISNVLSCWKKRELSSLKRSQEPLWRQEQMKRGIRIATEDNLTILEKLCAEAEECVTPGRSVNYGVFRKMAQQVRDAYFPDEYNLEDVEREFWRLVMTGNSHVCVHAASVDATEHCCGFTLDPSDSYAAHPWNLKKLYQNEANLFSYLDSSGVSSTAVHYGMMFTASCWHMDPTAVPWIEYLHSGSPKIWYSIAGTEERKFREAAKALCPFAVQNKKIWLPSDILMVPPSLLRQYGVNVERHVQYPGEYVIVYPNTYCACIDTGLTISEGVYFAPHDWMAPMNVEKVFQSLRSNCEPSLFSTERLLMEMACNEQTPLPLLKRVREILPPLLHSELAYRMAMSDRNIEQMSPHVFLEQNPRATQGSWQIRNSGECAYCRCHLYLSKMVGVTSGLTAVCAAHGIQLFDIAVLRRLQLTKVYCITLVSNNRIHEVLEIINRRRVMDPIDESD